MSPFEIGAGADIEAFVKEARSARSAMDELAAASKGGEKTVKSAKAASSFIDQLRKAAPQIALTAAAMPTIMAFMSGLTEPFDQVGEAVTELGLVASEGFEEMATDIADAIYTLEPVAEQVGDFIGDTYDKVQAKDWEGLSDNVETGLTSAWDGIVDFFDDEELMTDIGEGAAAVVNGIAGFLKTANYEDMEVIVDGITTAMTTFFEAVIWEDVFVGIVSALGNLGYALVNSFADGVETALEEARDENNLFTDNLIYFFFPGYGG